jgi:hypothetical protein
MKTNELREGNLFYHDKNKINYGTHIVCEITKNGIVNEHSVLIPYNEVEPIPLTEEWLLCFGAEYSHKVLDIKMYQLGLYFIAIRKEGFRFIKKSTNTGAYEPLKDLYFAHELQNIYHDLTNEELKLKQDETH